MKTTILIGYSQTDASGNPLGTATIISGPPADESAARAQAKLFSDAKQKHTFPKGVKFIAFCTCDQADAAAHISDDLAKQIAGREQERMVSIEAELAKANARNAQQTAIHNAGQRLSKAAVAHNNAVAALATAKSRLADAEANFKATKTDSHKAELTAARAKVEQLTKTESVARDELNEAKKAKADAMAGKISTAEAEEPDPNDGPTVQEYVAAGYNPNNYPPKSYVSKSSPEEIEKTIADFNAAAAEEAEAAAAAAKAEGLEKELLEMPRKELLALAKEYQAKNPSFNIPLISTKSSVVREMIKSGFKK